ncbi:DNA translocase FtsK [Jeotgalibacillus soli]|uniref:FtsK domain-containing protein n=1 Tax=Jeotgalibacillus soli TaxID=889306 RepID=A0A0C2VHA8_9BACL|nr:DNA translocase FtsK [Jeotgalibacillus soli]KIL43886.1 hypothetical protein KP78_37100 [Jeotgalibacillus soli]
MSWIKKALAFLKTEDETKDEPKPLQQKPVPVHRKSDLDTKMIYHYPKVEFRFPLIPDERLDQEQDQKEDPKPKYTKERQESTKPKNHTHSNESHTKTKDKPSYKPQMSNRPFTPTEVPSPIYGFNRPKPNTVENSVDRIEKVEYELTSNSTKKVYTQFGGITSLVSIDELSHKQSAEQETDHPIQFSKDNGNVTEQEAVSAYNNLTITKNDKESFLENIASDQDQLAVKIEQPEIEQKINVIRMSEYEGNTTEQIVLKEEVNSLVEVSSLLKNESKKKDLMQGISVGEDKATEKKTGQPSILQSLSQSDVINDQQTLSQDEANQAPEVISIRTQELVEEETLLQIVPFKETESEEMPIAVEGLMSPSTEVEQFSGKMDASDDLQTIQIDQNSNSDQNDEGLIEEIAEASIKEEQRIEPEQVAERKPRQIPFNVMMLKQDRRNLKKTDVSPKRVNQSEQIKASVSDSIEPPAVTLISGEEEPPYYAFPSMNLLNAPVHAEPDHHWLEEQAELLNETLFHFNVNAKVKHVTQGPSVTRFELLPEKGVKVSKITSLTDDIKLSLAARDIRMEAPIPGKNAIGIEIPNPMSRPVGIKEILDHPSFKESTATLPVALGLDIEGNPVVTDIGKMPHGLIAGATGSGKSVCINSILVSLLYHSTPDELRLLLIDPKMVELAPYNHIPHLVSPVITNVKAATAALKWAVEEMERRYQLFAHAGVRDIGRYNQKATEARQFAQKLPYLVIVIDELADLMMMSPADVEEAICRIAQKARACGIHLLIATQRPSVDVITGLIKANVPTRVAFAVSSQVDSRTIIDTSGADRLLGRGDMLFLGNGASKPVRLQGTFVSDEEIDAVVSHVRQEREVKYLFHQEELLAKVELQDEEDELLLEACEFVMSQGGASTSLLQRKFRIGYNRAARLIDMMEQQGWISEAKGSKPRDVLMTSDELQSMQETGTSL